MISDYLEVLESAFILSKEGERGFCERLYEYYKKALTVDRSTNDAILIGFPEDLREAIVPALLIFDKLFIIDSIGPLLCSLFEGARKYPALYGEITLYSYRTLQRYSFLKEYDGLVLVLPPLGYAGSLDLLKPLNKVDGVLDKSGVYRDIEKLEAIASRELGMPKYSYDHIKAAYVYGTSVYTADRKIIGSLSDYLSLEESLIYADGILGKYSIAKDGKTKTLSREKIDEIRSEYPPNKVRKALREGSNEIPKELKSVSSFYPKYPLISVLYACIGGALNAMGVPIPDVITIVKTLSSALVEYFRNERKTFVRYHKSIPGLYRRAHARDEYISRRIREFYSILSGFL